MKYEHAATARTQTTLRKVSSASHHDEPQHSLAAEELSHHRFKRDMTLSLTIPLARMIYSQRTEMAPALIF
jgi:hypothetical protein